MTSEKAKKWLVAVLSASGTVKALTGSPSTFSESEDSPARPGVYIDATSDARERRYADEVTFTIRGYVTSGEQASFNLAEAVDALLRATPGEARSWSPAPSAHGLKLWAIKREAFSPPERDGPASSGYAFRAVYSVRGRDTSQAA